MDIKEILKDPKMGVSLALSFVAHLTEVKKGDVTFKFEIGQNAYYDPVTDVITHRVKKNDLVLILGRTNVLNENEKSYLCSFKQDDGNHMIQFIPETDLTNVKV